MSEYGGDPVGLAVIGTSIYTTTSGTSTAEVAFPTASGGKAFHPQAGSTSTYRTLYPRRVRITATKTMVSVKFGVTGMGAAVAADESFPADTPREKILPKGTTHYRAISSDGSTAGAVKIEALEMDTEYPTEG